MCLDAPACNSRHALSSSWSLDRKSNGAARKASPDLPPPPKPAVTAPRSGDVKVVEKLVDAGTVEPMKVDKPDKPDKPDRADKVCRAKCEAWVRACRSCMSWPCG